jgi:branched-chain amino acid aminotransferase
MYLADHTVVYVNGEWINVKDAKAGSFSQTLHYGNGVFEGMRAYETPLGTHIFKAYEHYERLLYSCKAMGITIRYNVNELVEITYELLDRNNFKYAYIRPIVYLAPEMSLKTPAESNLMISAWKWRPYLGERLLNVMTSSYERPNPRSCVIDAKISGQYVTSILAVNEAKAKGYDEALLLDMNGFVAEGPGANFFYEKENILYTCPKGHILPGITRQTILQLAKDLEIPVREMYFTVEDVEGADGAFFAGTAAEVAGLKRLNNVPFKKPWAESFGYRLKKAYRGLVLSAEAVIKDVV